MPKDTTAVVEEAITIWENRITHYSNESPDQLLANPKNFRRHPVHQRRIFDAVASEVGIVVPVIQNDRSGNLLDGHLRVEEAMKKGVKELPVAHVDLSEEEEDKVLATLDALSAMAIEDADLKAKLLAGLTTRDDDLAEYFARELERQQAEAISQGEIGDLTTQYWTHDPESFWPVIRLRVPDDVRARFMAYFEEIDADTDHEKLTIMLDRLDAPSDGFGDPYDAE
jgi:hypothetical protein